MIALRTIAKIEIDGLKLEYQRQGTKDPTIVFLHGNSACKEVFYKQFEALNNDRFSLLAIDLPGHGGSSNALDPEQTYTIPSYAQTIDKAIKALGVKDYIVVGWSLGGQIALEMAGCNMDLKGMMIFGSPPAGPGLEKVQQGFVPTAFEIIADDTASPEAKMEAWLGAVYATLDPIPDNFRAAFIRTDPNARDRMLQHWLSAESGHDQLETATHWKKPICVVHGNLEAFVSLDYLKQTKWRNLWGGQIFELPKAGHATFVEDPHGFNAVLQKFAADVL
ncbi:MAG: alpha/beta hydrolase [Parvularculaceae bacterium]